MSSKHLSLFCCAAVALAVCASDAFAQPGRMMRMMGGGGQLQSELLAMEEVQKELNLTDEQKEEIVEAAKKIVQSWRTEMGEIRRAGGEQAEYDELLEDMRAEEKDVIAALDEEQKKRLNQLQVQRMGTQAFQHQSVAKSLKITDEQKEKIKTVFEKSREAVQEAIEDARDNGDFGSIRETFTKMQTDLETKIMNILTDEQKKKIKELKGEKFEFPQRQRRRQRQRTDF